MGSQFNVKQLKCFVMVAEERNFRRAAERLFMTQPPLSRHIKALEERLGAELFLRNRQSVQLTEFGQVFLIKACELLRMSDEMMIDVPARNAAIPHVLRIGMTTVLDPEFFSVIGPMFERENPECRVEFKRKISHRSIKDVGRGRLDLALIGLPTNTEGLPFTRLSEDPLVVAMPAIHRLARKHIVSLANLKDDKLFWFNRKLNPAYYDHCEQCFKRFDFNPERLPEPDVIFRREVAISFSA